MIERSLMAEHGTFNASNILNFCNVIITNDVHVFVKYLPNNNQLPCKYIMKGSDFCPVLN